MKYTEKFNLKKPEQTDSYNVNDFNDNMDLIEKLLAPEDISSKFVVTPVDETAQFAEIDDITVYKQGKVISGEVAISISGGGEHTVYIFEFPPDYATKTYATICASGMADSYFYNKPIAPIMNSNNITVPVDDPVVDSVILTFTYICE